MPSTVFIKRDAPAHGIAALSFVDVFRASPLERIEAIKAGVSAKKVKELIVELHFEQGVIFEALNLKTTTVNKKAAKDERLSAEDSERVMGLARLVGQVKTMLEDAGNPDGADAAEWLSRWLREPLPALGGSKPINLLDTMEGQALVSKALSQIQSGAYA